MNRYNDHAKSPKDRTVLNEAAARNMQTTLLVIANAMRLLRP